MKIEYDVDEGKMKINFEGRDGNYYAKLDKIDINPGIVDLHNFEVKKNNIKMDFNAPVVCNTENIDVTSSLLLGVKFEGKDKDKFTEEIEKTARSFGPEWEAAVKRRKKIIKERLKK